MIRFASLFALLLLLAPTAHAFRLLPENAQLAELRGFAFPRVNMSGNIMPVGPGLRIHDQNNRTITYGMLQKPGPAAFQLGPNREVVQIWLLTDEEADRLKKTIEQREALKKQFQQ